MAGVPQHRKVPAHRHFHRSSENLKMRAKLHPSLCFHREIVMMRKWEEIRKAFFSTLEALSPCPSSSTSFRWNEPKKLWRHAHEALGKWILSQIARITSPSVNMLSDLFFFPTEELLRNGQGSAEHLTSRSGESARRTGGGGDATLPHSEGKSGSGATRAAAASSSLSQITARNNTNSSNGSNALSYDSQLLRDLSLKSSACQNAEHMKQLKEAVEGFQLLKRCTTAAAEVEREMQEGEITPETALVPSLCVRHVDDLSRSNMQHRIKDTIVEITAKWPTTHPISTSGQNSSFTSSSLASSYGGNYAKNNHNNNNHHHRHHHKDSSSDARQAHVHRLLQRLQGCDPDTTPRFTSTSSGCNTSNNNSTNNTSSFSNSNGKSEFMGGRFPVVSIALVTYEKLKRSYELFGEAEDMKLYGYRDTDGIDLQGHIDPILESITEGTGANSRNEKAADVRNGSTAFAASFPHSSAPASSPQQRSQQWMKGKLTPHELFIRRAATVAFRYEGVLATGGVQLCADLTFKDHLTASGYYVVDYCASPMNAYEGKALRSVYAINKHLSPKVRPPPAPSAQQQHEEKEKESSLSPAPPLPRDAIACITHTPPHPLPFSSTSVDTTPGTFSGSERGTNDETGKEALAGKEQVQGTNEENKQYTSFLEGPHVFCSCFLDTDFYFGSLGSATRVPPQEVALAMLGLKEKEMSKMKKKQRKSHKRKASKRYDEEEDFTQSSENLCTVSLPIPPPLLLTYDVPYDEHICELLFLKLERDIRSSKTLQKTTNTDAVTSTIDTSDDSSNADNAARDNNSKSNNNNKGSVSSALVTPSSAPGTRKSSTGNYSIEKKMMRRFFVNGRLSRRGGTGAETSSSCIPPAFPLAVEVVVDYLLVIPLWWRIPLRIDKTVFLPSQPPIVVPVDYASGNIIISPTPSIEGGRYNSTSPSQHASVEEEEEESSRKTICACLADDVHNTEILKKVLKTQEAGKLASEVISSHASMLKEGYQVEYTWPERLALAVGNGITTAPGDVPEYKKLCWNGVFLDEAYEYFCATTNQWLRGVTTTEVIALHSVVSVELEKPWESVQQYGVREAEDEKEEAVHSPTSLISSSALSSSAPLLSSPLRSALSSFYGGPQAMPPAQVFGSYYHRDEDTVTFS